MQLEDGRVIGRFPCSICGSGMLGQRVYAHRNAVMHVKCATEITRAWASLEGGA